jgi:hypothetical protein
MAVIFKSSHAPHIRLGEIFRGSRGFVLLYAFGEFQILGNTNRLVTVGFEHSGGARDFGMGVHVGSMRVWVGYVNGIYIVIFELNGFCV